MMASHLARYAARTGCRGLHACFRAFLAGARAMSGRIPETVVDGRPRHVTNLDEVHRWRESGTSTMPGVPGSMVQKRIISPLPAPALQ